MCIRDRGVPGDYRRAAVECDRDWNGTLPGSVGAFEGYLASLPPVIGLGFGPFGEWSAEVDTLIGQVADIASACPAWAAATGRRRRAAGTRTGRGRTFIARCSGRSRGAGTRRWTACSTARRRRTRVTRSTAASWMTLPTNPALPTLGTPPPSEERSGAHPAAAPKLSLYIWPCI